MRTASALAALLLVGPVCVGGACVPVCRLCWDQLSDVTDDAACRVPRMCC